VVNNSFFGSYSIIKIVYGNGKWVAISEYYEQGDYHESGFGDYYDWNRKIKMAYSTNGETWTEIVGIILDINNDIAYGDGYWVAGGCGGKIAYSTDCENWTIVADSTFETDAITGVAYGDNKFIVVGQNGKIAYSGTK